MSAAHRSNGRTIAHASGNGAATLAVSTTPAAFGSFAPVSSAGPAHGFLSLASPPVNGTANNRSDLARLRPCMTRPKTADDRIGRREVAELLGRHPDSVTRLLPEGLGGAVLEWGGHGREMVFSRAWVERWRGARACPRRGHCLDCYDVLFDMTATAEHLAEAKHGLGGCSECGESWPMVMPCA